MLLDTQWRSAFFNVVQRPEYAARLKDASLRNANSQWTQMLTDAVVTVCQAQGWIAAAKGHPSQFLPESRSEYLGIDVAFRVSRPTRIWAFPVETVSQSESGFELVHQSVAVLPHWQLTPDAEGRWSITMDLAIDTSRAENHLENEVAAVTR